MPYEFPKHVLKQSEILDPDNLTLELTPAAEQLSGNLGATNFSGSDTSLDPMQAGENAFSQCKWTTRVGTNDFRRYGVGNGPGDSPTCPMGPTLYVTKSGWQTVCAIDYGYVTEPTRLWLSGIGQHLWYSFMPTYALSRDGVMSRPLFPGHWFQYGDLNQDEAWPSPRTTGLTEYPRKMYGAMVQWALRVNGRIIDDSVTGSHDDQQQGIVPIQLKTERLADEKLQFPGPSGEKTPQRASLGTIAWPCRLGTIVDVSPGNCVVELVVRRLDDDRYSKQYGNRIESNTVGVMNASLTIISLPTRVGSPISSSSVEATPFLDQEPFSPRSKLQNIIRPLKTLRDGNIAPGAFRPDHMIGGPVVTFDQISLHARTELGYSGFTYHNRRPDMELIPRFYGESGGNPNKPIITWDHATPTTTLPATGTMYGIIEKNDTSGWCMWAVRSRHGESRLDRYDALLTDHDASSISPMVTGTGNSTATEIVPNHSKEWRQSDQGFCVLRNRFPFKRHRNRGLLVTADVQVNLLHGNRLAFTGKGKKVLISGSGKGPVWEGDYEGADAGPIDDWLDRLDDDPHGFGTTEDGTSAYVLGGNPGSASREDWGHGTDIFLPENGSGSHSTLDGSVESQHVKRGYSNAGVFGFFRLGFHIEGRDDDDWVLPGRSEVFVNQFNNWREHPTLETDDEFRDTRPMATQANLSLQMMVSRPWLDEMQWEYSTGGREESPTMLGVMQGHSQNMVIDGVALFVAGGENGTFYAPLVGLSGANLSAMLIDFGHTDSHAGFETHIGSAGILVADE